MRVADFIEAGLPDINNETLKDCADRMTDILNLTNYKGKALIEVDNTGYAFILLEATGEGWTRNSLREPYIFARFRKEKNESR